MFKLIILCFAVLFFMECQSQQLRCGAIPKDMYTCLGNPKIIEADVVKQCGKSISECERIKCIFRKSGWTNKSSGEIDKQKLSEFFNKLAKDSPQWTQAVQKVKETCIAKDLPAQGIYTSCPAYDIAHCSLTAFLRNVPQNVWGPSYECQYARMFAASCPVCPEDCFAVAIPVGSCNACRLTPTN